MNVVLGFFFGAIAFLLILLGYLGGTSLLLGLAGKLTSRGSNKPLMG